MVLIKKRRKRSHNQAENTLSENPWYTAGDASTVIHIASVPRSAGSANIYKSVAAWLPGKV